MLVKKVKAYAKLNLSLNICGTRGERHLLDSVAASVNVWDTVCARSRRDSLINVYMHGLGSENIPPEQNNAVKAGEAFVSQFGTCGADIEVYKDIPMGAGMGGSSADAAGVLNALAAMYKIDDRTRLKAIADSLGSDTGYMLGGGFARMSEYGNRVEPIPTDMTLWFLLFLPKTSVSTARCFAQYDSNPEPLRADSSHMEEALRSGDFAGIAASMHNALGNAACELNSETARALQIAQSLSPSACAVTGAGSAVYALFENEQMCRWAKGHCKGFRTRIVHTVQPGRRVRSWKNPFVLSEEEKEQE